MLDPDFDLIVIGAGIAGLSAAVSAIDLGLSVALLEKTVVVGGSSAMSGGYLAFSGTEEQAELGIVDNEQIFIRDMLVVGGHENDESLLQAYVRNQRDAHDWIKSKGARFPRVEISSGQTVARGHHSDIKSIIALLEEIFETGGGRLLRGHRAVKLVTDDQDAVCGAVVETDHGAVQLHSSAVIIASGGFSRGTELLSIFAPEQKEAIPYGGIANTGDGLRMAWRLGAGMADMSHIAATYGSHPDTGIEFHELLTAYYLGAVMINRDGKRFTDESQSYKLLGIEALKQPDGISYQVFDSKVRALSKPIALSDMDMLDRIGHLYQADSLEKLAVMIDVPGESLNETIRSYNDSVRGKQPDGFGRSSLVAGTGALKTIDSPPYFAYPSRALMTSTYCGITVTPKAEVTTVDGEVIPGLYAAGEVVGGFHGKGYMTGTSLGKGLIFGRVAAVEAARYLRHNRQDGVIGRSKRDDHRPA